MKTSEEAKWVGLAPAPWPAHLAVPTGPVLAGYHPAPTPASQPAPPLAVPWEGCQLRGTGGQEQSGVGQGGQLLPTLEPS